MALQVWLPLTKDLRNQGLSNVTVTNYGATLDNNGKLGKCYYFDGTDDRITVSGLSLPNVWSYSCWIYSATSSRSWEAVIMLNSTGGDSDLQLGFYTYPGGNRIQNTANGQYNSGIAWTYGVWHHFCGTFDGSNLKTYIDGILINTKAITASLLSRTNLTIGARSTNAANTTASTFFQGKLNDVRIYDHCLSPMEVKELSKGLVLHYLLNRGGLGPSNLIKNGFGELGTENWTSSANISTTDIPSGQSDIKISVTNNYTVERIKIYSTHTYKFSAWIKATTTSGNTYPSLFPYDVDGKFINNYNCPDGYNLNTMTTLKQQLKSGDTKIYVNDLSQWNANSGHYYNWAAIFSYTDGKGYTYPDGTYTQNMCHFGTSTNAKTNLDKTNNVITLLSAYTGPTMPIGTKLCASTEGATYYYPLGGINLANIQDWTYKEGTFSASTARLKYAKEVMFWTYTNDRMAGIKLQDLTNEGMDSTTEYDCSGFCNNGEKVGTLTYNLDTAKYSVSTVFNGSTTAIFKDNFNIAAPFSACCWAKYNNFTNLWLFQHGTAGGYNYTQFGCHALTNGNGYGVIINTQYTAVDNLGSLSNWHHIAITFDGSILKVYFNGELKLTKTINSTAYNGTRISIGRYYSNTYYNGKASDFRIYATALSADDVKSLYQNSAYIDSSGNVYGAVHSEV